MKLRNAGLWSAAKERKLAVFQQSRHSEHGAGPCGLDHTALLRLHTAHLRGPQHEDLAGKGGGVTELRAFSGWYGQVSPFSMGMVPSKVCPLPPLLSTKPLEYSPSPFAGSPVVLG